MTNSDIDALEEYFKSIALPSGSVYLHPSTRINDVPFFLESHFSALRLDPTSKMNIPIYDRLVALKALLEDNQLYWIHIIIELASIQ